MAKIEHVFVLMLENRSFDHLFAFSGFPGVPQPPARFNFKPGAPDRLRNDPPHEFENVRDQIKGGAMTGFAGDALHGFVPSAIPTLVTLAKNSLFFDNWYSSMPGPTWPNRLFAHAGSSSGLDNSLGNLATGGSVTQPGQYLRFDHLHIYEQLVSKGATWRVYRGDTYPQVLSLRGMIEKKDQFFRPIEQLQADLRAKDAASYAFIEPRYDPLWSFASGNSQHPLGSVAAGETLIAYVYNAIFQSPVGASSALLVTWDEHGGFFDQVSPPPAIPPGDAPLSHKRAANPGNCRFDTYGVRVPAMLVSPWLPVGLGSRIFPGTTFDHASIVSSLRETFNLVDPLTRRDAGAPTWLAALLPKPRKIETLVTRRAAIPKMDRSLPDLRAISVSGMPSGTVMGMAHIAVDIDWYIAERTGVAPLIASEFQKPIAAASELLDNKVRGAPATASKGALSRAHRTVLEYLAAVQTRDLKYERVRAAGLVRQRIATARSPKAKARRRQSRR